MAEREEEERERERELANARWKKGMFKTSGFGFFLVTEVEKVS